MVTSTLIHCYFREKETFSPTGLSTKMCTWEKVASETVWDNLLTEALVQWENRLHVRLPNTNGSPIDRTFPAGAVSRATRREPVGDTEVISTKCLRYLPKRIYSIFYGNQTRWDREEAGALSDGDHLRDDCRIRTLSLLMATYAEIIPTIPHITVPIGHLNQKRIPHQCHLL